MGQVSPRCAQMLSTANHALTLDVKLYFQFYLTHQEREEREGTFKMSGKLKKKEQSQRDYRFHGSTEPTKRKK